MLTPPEERLVLDLAYVPEHIPGYVRSISHAEPHLLGDFLCYSVGNSLTFIGYPLQSAFDPGAVLEAVRSAMWRFGAEQVALVAPRIPAGAGLEPAGGQDHYYRLDLLQVACPSKVQNMIRRASRDLRVETSRELQEDHLGMIAEFLEARQRLGRERRDPALQGQVGRRALPPLRVLRVPAGPARPAPVARDAQVP
jgi:hypothetical protein